VKVHDPVALERFKREYPNLGVICCETAEQTAEGADAVVLVTEWPLYRDLNWEALAASMRTRIVLDGRNVLDRARLTRAGFHCLTMNGDVQAAVESALV
jgi:UDPglucose 6-dehydrogenase